MINKLIRKPKSTEQQENKYENLGFIQNPFPNEPAVKPYSSDPRVNGSLFLTSLREEEIQSFKTNIVNSPNKIGLMMDYAAYKGRGIGKTAFLNYMKKSINADLGDEISGGDSVLYAVYVAPSADKSNRTLEQISQTIFSAMQKEGLFLTIFCRLRALSGLLDEVIDDSINESNYEITIANDNWIKEKNIDLNEVNKFVQSKLIEVGLTENDNLFGCNYSEFCSLLKNNDTEFFWKKNGLNYLFNNIEKLLKAALFTNCIILLDEAEKMIQYQNFNERRAFCDNLRTYFIDGSNSNAIDGFFKIVLTIHPNSQELLMPHWAAAGLDRFCSLGGNTSDQNTIFFKPITNNQEIINSLTELYLNNSRIDKQDKSIKPFTQDAIDSAMEKSGRIPGKFLKLLYIVIEKAVKYGWEKIDTEQINLTWKDDNEQPSLFNNDSISSKELTPTKINLMD